MNYKKRSAVIDQCEKRLPGWYFRHVTKDDGSLDPFTRHVLGTYAGCLSVRVYDVANGDLEVIVNNAYDFEASTVKRPMQAAASAEGTLARFDLEQRRSE